VGAGFHCFSEIRKTLRRNVKKEERNPPEVRVMSGQEFCTEIIYVVLQMAVQLFKYPPKKSILTTPVLKTNFKVHVTHLKVLVK